MSSHPLYVPLYVPLYHVVVTVDGDSDIYSCGGVFAVHDRKSMRRVGIRMLRGSETIRIPLSDYELGRETCRNRDVQC